MNTSCDNLFYTKTNLLNKKTTIKIWAVLFISMITCIGHTAIQKINLPDVKEFAIKLQIDDSDKAIEDYLKYQFKINTFISYYLHRYIQGGQPSHQARTTYQKELQPNNDLKSILNEMNKYYLDTAPQVTSWNRELPKQSHILFHFQDGKYETLKDGTEVYHQINLESIDGTITYPDEYFTLVSQKKEKGAFGADITYTFKLDLLRYIQDGSQLKGH